MRVAAGIEPELWSKIRVRARRGHRRPRRRRGPLAAPARQGRPPALPDRARAPRRRVGALRAAALARARARRAEPAPPLRAPTPSTSPTSPSSRSSRALDAQIIARAQQHADLRSQAARYTAVREVREILGARTPLEARLAALCRVRRAPRRRRHRDPLPARSRRGRAALRGDLARARRSLLAELRHRHRRGHRRRGRRERRADLLRRHGRRARLRGAAALRRRPRWSACCRCRPARPRRATRTLEETLREIADVAAEEIAKAEREARTAHRATKIGAINEAGLQHDLGHGSLRGAAPRARRRRP